ncbi:hypothetical protein GCM10009530_59120 [Microbispora corallina]|uniref:Uncharacterized protein n=1 Tax=Microbispora corallina TaxID=83302 RepID=A0ABQ4G025_9ACTN|nr:hypothetical protein Mco01_34220 [Microbispora corallina]
MRGPAERRHLGQFAEQALQQHGAAAAQATHEDHRLVGHEALPVRVRDVPSTNARNLSPPVAGTLVIFQGIAG